MLVAVQEEKEEPRRQRRSGGGEEQAEEGEGEGEGGELPMNRCVFGAVIALPGRTILPFICVSLSSPVASHPSIFGA